MTITGVTKISNKDLADVLGRAIAARKAAEEYEKGLKDELARRGLDHIIGTTFEVNVSVAMNTIVDRKELEAVMGQDWVKRFTKSFAVSRVLAKIRKDVAAEV